MWRVFGTNELTVDPAWLLDHLHALDFEVTGQFKTDEQGWFHADLVHEDFPIEIDRFLSSEEGVRGELNSWAAWLEEHAPQHMQHLISTRQIFTVHMVDEDEELALALCRYLAKQTDGIYQVDGRGFYDAAGTLLVAE